MNESAELTELLNRLAQSVAAYQIGVATSRSQQLAIEGVRESFK